MKKNTPAQSNRYPVLLAGAVGLGAYALFLRPRQLRWGATFAEANQTLPGDDLVPVPNFRTTRAITIQAPPARVWPWILQIGYQRGGFYSYDTLERLAGLVDLRSTNKIVPDWQAISAGEAVLISPVTPLDVVIMEPERAFVLHTVMNPFTAERAEPQSGSAYMNWSWAFILAPVGAASTRLLIRVRAELQPRLLATAPAWLVLEPLHFLMERKMLQGIKTRAEAGPVY